MGNRDEEPQDEEHSRSSGRPDLKGGTHFNGLDNELQNASGFHVVPQPQSSCAAPFTEGRVIAAVLVAMRVWVPCRSGCKQRGQEAAAAS